MEITEQQKTEANLTRRKANYVLAVLFLVTMLNFLDRQIISILAEPIKRDMGLSDKQIGLMTGLSFALFYTTLAIPVAALADRWNRSKIIAIAVTIWSIMTLLCGVAGNFLQMFLARIGVGIGESAAAPASHSLIADLFPPERRAGALGILGMSVPIGAFLAYAGGGWVAEHFGWRLAFLLAAVPGIIIGLMMWFTVRDPRGTPPLAGVFAKREGEIGLKEAVAQLTKQRGYWQLIGIGTLVHLVAYGQGAFIAAHFARTHGLDYAEIGLKLGLMVLIAGASGAYLGGKLGDWLDTNRPAVSLLACGAVFLLSIPATILAIYSENVNMAMVLFGVQTFAATFYYGPTYSAVQTVATDRTRAMAIAIFLMISGLIGLGLGPVLVGALSDFFAAGDVAAEGPALQKALAILALFNVWTAFHFWRSYVHLKKSVAQP